MHGIACAGHDANGREQDEKACEKPSTSVPMVGGPSKG